MQIMNEPEVGLTISWPIMTIFAMICLEMRVTLKLQMFVTQQQVIWFNLTREESLISKSSYQVHLIPIFFSYFSNSFAMIRNAWETGRHINENVFGGDQLDSAG